MRLMTIASATVFLGLIGLTMIAEAQQRTCVTTREWGQVVTRCN